MTNPYEMGAPESPVDAFRRDILAREDEPDVLLAGLEEGLALLEDMEEVNARLAASVRPDLVITTPAEQMPLDWPVRHRSINNFIPRLRGFGPDKYEVRRGWSRGPDDPVFVGRHQPTQQDLETYFLLGARGTFDESMDFAAAHGIGQEVAMVACFQSAAYKPAFMRMWVLFPELTETIIRRCVADDRPYEAIDDEVFVAYSLMSKLVDAGDPSVTKEDGQIDGWSLCR